MSMAQRIKYLTLALIAFTFILATNLIYLFQPLYNQVYYGQANYLFYYGGSTVLLLILFIIYRKVIIKKMDVVYNSKKEPLSLNRLLLVYLITITIIFIISGIIGWNVKIFYDLGTDFTGFQLLIQGAKLIYCSFLMLFVILMIENFQYGLEGLIPFKDNRIHKYFPIGGITTMLTYGVYQLIIGLTTLYVLYFFLITVYGFIYLLVDKSFKKAYISSLFIFLF